MFYEFRFSQYSWHFKLLIHVVSNHFVFQFHKGSSFHLYNVHRTDAVCSPETLVQLKYFTQVVVKLKIDKPKPFNTGLLNVHKKCW